MILLWVTLLVLHQGYSLVPVTTVQLGEPATFTCALPDKGIGRPQLNWYKQSAGETLKLIVRKGKSTKPAYEPEFPESRLEMNNDNNFSNLTILRTIQEDEGMYHCASTEWNTSPVWSGTYLLIKGNTQRTSNYTVVQWPTVSDPVRPGDSVTLQCSVLSDSGNKMCPGDDSVFWFRAGSNKSYPDIIYTDRRRHNECDKRSDTQKSCVYRFSKNISSSDDGTYYCAVATCGEILFGDGTKLDIEGTSVWSQKANTIIFSVISAISLIVTAVLIYAIQRNSAAVAEQKHSGGQKIPQRDEDRSIYSAVVFTVMKTGCGAIKDSKAAERQRSYAAVKAFGLD
ncbi:signal-regulatory protein beta-2-like [Perca flavescens]|uniref:signal-regulatory protein beta-2-like n=1 Tax=Perca flavescens TaxID=8167 RepID=UPI00106E4602|nr:signal-regulatory protein beta-2-like [Perca flavescens]